MLDQFRQSGCRDHVESWVGIGQNCRLAPDELTQALVSDTLDEQEQQTELPRQQFRSELSEELIDHAGSIVASELFDVNGRRGPEWMIASPEWDFSMAWHSCSLSAKPAPC